MKLQDLKDGKHFRLAWEKKEVILLLLAEGEWDSTGHRRAVAISSGTIYTLHPDSEITQVDIEVEATETMTFGQLKPRDFFRYRGDLFVILPPVDFCGGGMACKVSGGPHFAPHTPVTKVS